MNHPNELPFPLPETHESLVKYASPNNSSYQAISLQIQYLANEAVKKGMTEPQEARLRDLHVPCT